MTEREIAQKKAYAKLNLHLEVLNKRDDGYHNLFSVMAKTSVHDLLKLKLIEKRKHGFAKIKISCNAGTHQEIFSSLEEKSNLIYRAALAYCQKAGIRDSLEFVVEKNIPAGGGLAGGSSDAAAALLLLNDYYQAFSFAQLTEIAVKLGADIPFCLQDDFAFCEGIGEKITPIKSKLDSYLVLINNGIHVDTGKAYAMLNRTAEAFYSEKEILEKKKEINNGLASEGLQSVYKILKNDFEKVVFCLHPELDAIKMALYKEGAEFAMMTGSGSTVFGIFSDRQNAVKAVNSLCTIYQSVDLIRFL